MLLQVAQKVGIWGFGSLWFTFADPEPQEILLTDLDPLTQEKVKVALHKGILIEVDQNNQPIIVTQAPKQNIQSPVVQETTEIVTEISPVVIRKIKELLKNGVTTLRKEIPSIKSHQMLSAALRLEKATKNRKTVIKIIQNVIQKSGNLKMYDDLIVEDTPEVVSININTMILKHESQQLRL